MLRAYDVKLAGTYKYKYNGKELEDELGKNTYAYGWRDYDPAIGRFNKMDRFSEKYHTLTPYGYAGNNPILFNDIQGDSIGIGRDLFDRFKNEVQGQKIKILNSRSNEINRLIKKGKNDKAAKKQEKYAAEDAKEGSKMSVLNSTLSELDALENSSQLYNLFENSSEVPSSADGITTYDINTDAVNVSSKGRFSMGVFAHELKHAYQFETGNLSFFADGNGGQLYDRNDEYEAFARGSFFGGLNLTRSQIDSHYSNRPQGPLNLYSPATAAKGVSTFGQQFKLETYRSSSRGTAQKQFYINWKNDTK